MGEPALIRQAVYFIVSNDIDVLQNFDKIERTMVCAKCWEKDFP